MRVSAPDVSRKENLSVNLLSYRKVDPQKNDKYRLFVEVPEETVLF